MVILFWLARFRLYVASSTPFSLILSLYISLLIYLSISLSPSLLPHQHVVREMNRLGMMVDISHVSPQAMNQVLDVTEAPGNGTHPQPPLLKKSVLVDLPLSLVYHCLSGMHVGFN